MSDLKKFIQAQQFQLAGSGVSLSDTSIILKSFKLPNSQALITNSDLGAINYATLEGGTAREEAISFTGVTQNADGTATITGVIRGLKFVAPYDQDLSLRDGHGGGTSFVITNGPGFYNEFTSKVNDETIEQLWSFIQNPQKTSDVLAANNRDFVTKNDLIAAALGTLAITGTVQVGTSGEAIALGKLCYLKTADNRWWKSDAATPATFNGVQLGISQTAPGGAGVSMNVLPFGVDVNQSGLTPGAKYYLSDTAGAISATAGTNAVFVGWALTATTLLFVRNNDINGPTANEKAAMAGSSGTPSNSNRFVTEDETSETASSKLVRRQSDGSLAVPSTPTDALDAASKAYVDLKDYQNFATGSASGTLPYTAPLVFTVTHNLGVIPRYVKLHTGGMSTSVGNAVINTTTGAVILQKCNYHGEYYYSGSVPVYGISPTTIGMAGTNGSSSWQEVPITLSAVTTTQMTFTVGAGGIWGPSGSVSLVWEAQG